MHKHRIGSKITQQLHYTTKVTKPSIWVDAFLSDKPGSYWFYLKRTTKLTKQTRNHLKKLGTSKRKLIFKGWNYAKLTTFGLLVTRIRRCLIGFRAVFRHFTGRSSLVTLTRVNYGVPSLRCTINNQKLYKENLYNN